MKYSDNKTNYQRKLAHPDWQKKRLEVLNRDEFTCQLCGSKDKELHVHHKYYLRGKEPYEYPLNAFETLCFECHEIETDNLTDATHDILQVLKQAGCDSFLINYLSSVFTKQMPCTKNRAYEIIETMHLIISLDDNKPGYIDKIWNDHSEMTKELGEEIING